MNKKIIFGLCILLLAISPVLAQSGGGGGAIAPATYTYSQCNELLDGHIELYEWWGTFYKVNAIILGILILIILSWVLVSFGMELQKIKDIGFKRWWRENR